MALSFRNVDSLPTYTALSTDISGSKIDGASIISGTIFLTDTGDWKIILPDLTLTDFIFPVGITLAGDIEIGAVELKDATTNTRATVGANGLHVDVQSMASTGLATSASQTIQITTASAILKELEGKADLSETQPVSASSLPLPTGAATSTNQTSGSQKTRIFDVDGLGIGSSQDSDGNNHLSVAVIQDVNEDPNNTSDINLTSANGYAFSGSATSTLGVVGLQWSLHTDQNATVYVEQSPDGNSWDLSYPFEYIASKGGHGDTVQATQAYWRLRVVLTGTVDTTYFRLQGVLCPIATPLPSHLSPDGRLTTETTITGRQNSDRHVFVSPLNSLTTNTTVRLVGTSFDGNIKDTNFWTGTVTNSGSATQNGGEIVLATSGSPNGTAKYQTVDKARFVVSRPLKFFGFYALATNAQANNIRRWGAYDVNNGIFFEMNGTAFRLVTRRGASGSATDVPITSGSFNGWYGNIWSPLASETYYRYEIEYGVFGVQWYVNGKLLHSLGIGHWTNTYTLPITFENNNASGNTTNNLLDCLGTAILGQGELLTNPKYAYVGTNGSTVLKQGAGTLVRVTVTDNQGTLLVYDGTSASGTLIANLDAAKTVGTMEFGAPFSNGLTVSSAGTPKMTVLYE